MREPWAAGRGAEAPDVCTPSSLRNHPGTSEPRSTGESPVIWKRSLENCFRGCPSPVLCKILFPCKERDRFSETKGQRPEFATILASEPKKKRKKKKEHVPPKWVSGDPRSPRPCIKVDINPLSTAPDPHPSPAHPRSWERPPWRFVPSAGIPWSHCSVGEAPG